MNVVRRVLCLASMVAISKGDSPPEILKDPSFLQLLNKHYLSVQPPKISWGYGGSYEGYKGRPKEDYPFSGSGYESSPGYDPQYERQQMQTEKPSVGGDEEVPISSQEYWNPTNALTTPWNATQSSFGYETHYGKPQADPGSSYTRWNPHSDNDPMQGSYSFHRYQKVPSNFVTVKKPPGYYGKGKIVKVSDTGAKATNIKYKKIPAPLGYYPNHNPNPYKKVVFPKVQVPYPGHKHPSKKAAVPVALHPYYRKYYPYYTPQYLTPNKSKKPYGYPEGYNYYRNPEFSTLTPDSKISSTTEKYRTTERMDGIYSEKPLNYEDYTNYNDTYSKSNYESYEEQEEPPSEDSGYEQEVTTRGYYGDRIYMSTQGPEKKKNSPNRLYFVRSEARDDNEDSETIFD